MKQNPRTLTVLAAARPGQDNVSWIEVLPTADQARNGSFFFTVTREDLDAAAAFIQANPDKIPVDRDHEGVDGSTLAAGWFTGAAKVVEEGAKSPQGDVQDHPSVWAEVSWTPAAAQQIRDGEYKFISPEWSFAQRDKKSGLLTKFKDMIAATLTNRPFFNEMAPVKASDLSGDDAIRAYATAQGVDAAKFAAALAAADGDETLETVVATAKTAAPAPKPDPSKEDEVDSAVLKALGLKEDASSEEIVLAVTELKEKVAVTESFDKGVLEQLARTTAAELEKDRELAKLQRDTAKKQHERDREDLLAKAVEQGRILPVHKDALRAVYDSTSDGPEKVTAIIEASPMRTWNEQGGGGEGSDDRPEVREIRDKRGNLVATVIDDEWLDKKAKAILAEAGKPFTKASADEYADALAQARALAEQR
jgi:phage I-like protein